MAYTIIDSVTRKCLPIRLIMDRQPGQSPAWLMFGIGGAFKAEWLCDPCNKSAERYWVKFEGGSEQFFPWFMVIEPSDDWHDIAIKLAHYAQVKTAAINLDRARQEYRRVTGFDAHPDAIRIPEEAFA
jgi:hypothetical protein